MVHNREFWEKRADKYSRQPVADEASYQRKLEVTRKYFRPDMEVLEIGCGTGSTAISHAPYVKHIRATDFSSRMIEIAKEKARAACIRDMMLPLRLIVPAGRFLRLFPLVKVFSSTELKESLQLAGFEITHE